jgi:regulator of G-protein signaling
MNVTYLPDQKANGEDASQTGKIEAFLNKSLERVAAMNDKLRRLKRDVASLARDLTAGNHGEQRLRSYLLFLAEERAYVRVLQTNVIASKSLLKILGEEDIRRIYLNTEEIYEVHSRFCQELQDHLYAVNHANIDQHIATLVGHYLLLECADSYLYFHGELESAVKLFDAIYSWNKEVGLWIHQHYSAVTEKSESRYWAYVNAIFAPCYRMQHYVNYLVDLNMLFPATKDNTPKAQIAELYKDVSQLCNQLKSLSSAFHISEISSCCTEEMGVKIPFSAVLIKEGLLSIYKSKHNFEVLRKVFVFADGLVIHGKQGIKSCFTDGVAFYANSVNGVVHEVPNGFELRDATGATTLFIAADIMTKDEWVEDINAALVDPVSRYNNGDSGLVEPQHSSEYSYSPVETYQGYNTAPEPVYDASYYPPLPPPSPSKASGYSIKEWVAPSATRRPSTYNMETSSADPSTTFSRRGSDTSVASANLPRRGSNTSVKMRRGSGDSVDAIKYSVYPDDSTFGRRKSAERGDQNYTDHNSGFAWSADVGHSPVDAYPDGDSELHAAVSYGYSTDHVVRHMIATGYNPNQPNDYGETPLHRAVSGSYFSGVRILFDAGGLLHAADYEGNTSFHYSVGCKGYANACVQFLDSLAYGIAIPNNLGNTVLHTAVENRCDNGTLSFLATKVPIDTPNADGNTPLHLAVWYEQEAIAVHLLELGANPNCVNNEGVTVGALAQQVDNHRLQVLFMGEYPFDVSELRGINTVESPKRRRSRLLSAHSATGYASTNVYPTANDLHPVVAKARSPTKKENKNSKGRFFGLFGKTQEPKLTSALMTLPNPEALTTVLSTGKGAKAFADHLKNEHSSENLEFWAAVNKFKKNPTIEEATIIYQKYVSEDAEAQVNLSYSNLAKVKSAFASASIDGTTFDKAQEEIFLLMSKDNFQRFKKSALFKSILS